MKDWAPFSECAGKTIAGIDHEDDEQVAIAFTDGSWSTLSLGRDRYSDDFDSIESTQPELLNWTQQLQRIGVMTGEEVRALIRESEEATKAKRIAHERAELERVRAKLEASDALARVKRVVELQWGLILPHAVAAACVDQASRFTRDAAEVILRTLRPCSLLTKEGRVFRVDRVGPDGDVELTVKDEKCLWAMSNVVYWFCSEQLQIETEPRKFITQ